MKTLDISTLLYDPTSIFSFPGEELQIHIDVLKQLAKYAHEHSRRGSVAREVGKNIDIASRGESLADGVYLANGSFLRVVSEIDLTSVLVATDPMARIIANSNRRDSVSYDALLHKNVAVETPILDTDSDFVSSVARGEEDIDIDYDGYATIRAGSQSVLTKISNGKVRQINQSTPFKVKPRNKEQSFAIDAILDPRTRLIAFTGKAGTGKTLLSVACGLELVMERKMYKKLIVTRPIMPLGNDIGYLPGTVEDKMSVWMKPIYDNLEVLLPQSSKRGGGGQGAVKEMEHLGYLEIEPLTYIRGRSISNAIVFLDEAQNLSPHEIKTLLTRAGENTKFIIAGDPYQVDGNVLNEFSNGLSYTVTRMLGESIFAHVHFLKGERSELAEVAACKM
jgi:PhoH-like ATPase